MPRLNLMTFNNPKMAWCNTLYLTMDIMGLLTLLIVLFLLFAPCICNRIARFVSSCMKAFKFQTAASPNYYLGPLDHETLNMRVRKIYCLTNLGTTSLISLEAVTEQEQCPLSLGNIILLK